jgi:hypothetical protein
MRRFLLISVLSVALTFGPITFMSSPVHGAAYGNPEVQKSTAPPNAVKNSDSSKSTARSEASRVKPGAKTRRGSASGGLTRVQMQNVDFHVDDTIVLRIRTVRGALLRKNPAKPAFFDDKQSFDFRIDSGVIGISTESLANLLNNYVFAYPKAPLKDVSLTIEDGKIKMKGTVHKITDLPFEVVGNLLATPEGKIQLHPTSIKTGGIPVKGLMGLFGIELDELIKGTESRGVKIDDNDITMDPEVMIPPPQVRGKITAIRIEGDEVIQIFGTDTKASIASNRKRSNFMYYRGGTIRFGKLTMSNADLRLVDRDPKTPFDFSMDHYNSQLVAGYSKNQPNLGLVVYVPDYYRIQRSATKATSAAGNTVSRR